MSAGDLAQRRSRLRNFIRATALLAVVCVAGCTRDDTIRSSDKPIKDQGDVVTMDPSEILFSTPTLNDAIPATLQGSTVSADCIQLHEEIGGNLS